MEGVATRKNEQALKEAIGIEIDKRVPNELLKKFMGLNVKHFFTINNDYCLERAIDPYIKKTSRKKQEEESKKYWQVGS